MREKPFIKANVTIKAGIMEKVSCGTLMVVSLKESLTTACPNTASSSTPMETYTKASSKITNHTAKELGSNRRAHSKGYSKTETSKTAKSSTLMEASSRARWKT